MMQTHRVQLRVYTSAAQGLLPATLKFDLGVDKAYSVHPHEMLWCYRLVCGEDLREGVVHERFIVPGVCEAEDPGVDAAGCLSVGDSAGF